MLHAIQDGLMWEQKTFEPVPKWTRDPSISAIESVCRQQLKIAEDDYCTVEFYAQGLFNKIYRVKYAGDGCSHYTRHLTRLSSSQNAGRGHHNAMGEKENRDSGSQHIGL